MNAERVDSRRVVAWIRRLGLQEPAAVLLEALGPLAILGAQAAYLAEPLFGGRGGPLHDLARMLEAPEDVSALVESLREEGET